MANEKRPNRDARDTERDDVTETPDTNEDPKTERPNPPRTTTGVWTSPKFGSAGSGGAELEPGFDKD